MSNINNLMNDMYFLGETHNQLVATQPESSLDGFSAFKANFVSGY
jgi:hypothetical protein